MKKSKLLLWLFILISTSMLAQNPLKSTNPIPRFKNIQDTLSLQKFDFKQLMENRPNKYVLPDNSILQAPKFALKQEKTSPVQISSIDNMPVYTPSVKFNMPVYKPDTNVHYFLRIKKYESPSKD